MTSDWKVGTVRATDDLLTEDFYLKAASRKLRVRRLTHSDSGTGSRHPVLVFLHEGLGCIELWHDFPSLIAKATRCDALLYDRWGHGKSEPLELPRPPHYVHDEALEALPEVLERCRADNAILIGHSDGGSIALIFAAAYPEVARGLVTEAAHVFVEEITLEGIRAAVVAYGTTDLKEKLARYHGDNTELIFRGWCDTWLSPEFKEWNIEEYLPKITSPLLVLQGEDDEYGSEAQVQAIASQVSGPSTPLLVPNCAHIPHHQARDVVTREITQFIRSLL